MKFNQRQIKLKVEVTLKIGTGTLTSLDIFWEFYSREMKKYVCAACVLSG